MKNERMHNVLMGLIFMDGRLREADRVAVESNTVKTLNLYLEVMEEDELPIPESLSDIT